MNKKHLKSIVIIVIAIFILVAYLIYTRPVSISQLYPMLSLDKCTEIHGYFRIDEQPELSEFTIGRDSEDFQKFCDLFYDRSYKRSLKDIFPRGTRTHPVQLGDFKWEALFRLKDIEFPDGSTGSGDILQFEYWYGELNIQCDGEDHFYKTSQQASWAADVLEIILANKDND